MIIATVKRKQSSIPVRWMYINNTYISTLARIWNVPNPDDTRKQLLISNLLCDRSSES